ncbi:glycerate kinase [Saccharomonospora sp. NPDC046836]|uniref:glycerate kinase n=1 Tax=Saccharomonospora sp. NPDC046836 TaxID=3156921 RepID=UPI0033DF9B06
MSAPARVLVAQDKFKGTLDASRAAEVIAAAVREVRPAAGVTVIPVVDSGEGTVDAVVAAGGRHHPCTVTGPLGKLVRASWAALGDRAVVEIAAASGLQLITPSARTALLAHSIGTGELIRAALDAGYRKITIGLGGSACTDGGTGILSALGARFLDRYDRPVGPGGGELSRIARVDLSGLLPQVAESTFLACCEVEVPMFGPDGAAAVFGPQKGADPETVGILDDGLIRLSRVLAPATGLDAAGLAWGGAAGGAAAGLHAVLGAARGSAFDAVADLVGLDDLLERTDPVVVGERKLGSQSLARKAPIGLALRARDRSIPVVAVVGTSDLPTHRLREHGIRVIGSASGVAGGGAEAMRDPTTHLRTAARCALRSYLDMPLSHR